MSNGTDGATSCDVSGSAVSAAATACSTCGAQRGGTGPTGARAPEGAANLLRVGEPVAPAASSSLTAAGLPSRTPRRDLDDDSLREAFARSWESSSEPTPPTRPPFTP